jgi:addiction module HigA family antidote
MSRQAGRQIEPIHPGEHVAEFLEELGITQYRLAKEVHVSQMRISEIIRGKRGITADTALRFGKFFGTSPQFWLSLQARYDLETTEDRIGSALEEVHEFRTETA